MAGHPWELVRPALESHNGFVEGPGNQNPWTEEFGIGDASYCVSEGTLTMHDAGGVDFPDDAQFPHQGWAYVPFLVTWAIQHGVWEPDRASKGQPAQVHEGDGLCWDWNYDGVADHYETAMSDDDGSDGYVHNIHGANTGSPEGVHQGFSRPRRYLLGVVHWCLWPYNQPTPAPPPPNCPPSPTPLPANSNPYCPLTQDGQFGPTTTKALQWSLNDSQVPDAWGRALVVDGDFGGATKTSLQRYLGVRIDGDFGPGSISALQAHVGATVDGQWGGDTTWHLQVALNNLTF